MVSYLNENLVLLFNDYITETPFLSFLGTNKPTETAATLLEYSNRKHSVNYLKLVPECVAKLIDRRQFEVQSDVDSNDYILSVPFLSNLDTISVSSSKAAKGCHNFLRHYPHFRVEHLPQSSIAKSEFIELFRVWARYKALDHRELNEYSAFERLINNPNCNNNFVAIYLGEKLVGFFTYELLSKDFAIGHFGKALIDYIGIYDALAWELGKALNLQNVPYFNYEQDLGLEGLRQAKRKLRPAYFLNKYIVTPINRKL